LSLSRAIAPRAIDRAIATRHFPGTRFYSCRDVESHCHEERDHAASRRDFPEWYQQAIRAAELAESSDVRGCMVIGPWGYGIWKICSVIWT